MNLHGIVSGVIGTVNPFVPVTLQQSSGYATAPDGERTPAYTASPQSVQVQALSAKEVQHLIRGGVHHIHGLAGIGIDPFAVDVALLAEKAGILERQSGGRLFHGLLHGDPRKTKSVGNGMAHNIAMAWSIAKQHPVRPAPPGPLQDLGDVTVLPCFPASFGA